MDRSTRRHAVGSLALLVIAAACGGGGNGDSPAVANRRTSLCTDIVGMEAIAWEYYNGVIVLDPVLPPPIPPPGGTFTHVDFPLLGFIYPPGWTPTQLRGSGVTGVDLIRDDQTAIWRFVSVTTPSTPDVNAVREVELEAARTFFNVNGTFNVVCVNEGTVEQAPGTGIFTTFSNVLVRGDARTVLLTTSVTPFPGLPQASVAVRLISSPTAEFPDRLFDTFMAIDWQMLIGSGESSSDRDGDGWLDQFDSFPDDPNRH